MNENNELELGTNDNSIVPIDYTDSINNLIDSNVKVNETLKSIDDNLKFLRDHLEITEEEQKIIDKNQKKIDEELSKQKEKDTEQFFSLLNETSLDNIYNELKLINNNTSENNIIASDSSSFISTSFIFLLGLLIAFYVIKFIKSIFDSFL